jgi:hypothetical protein
MLFSRVDGFSAPRSILLHDVALRSLLDTPALEQRRQNHLWLSYRDSRYPCDRGPLGCPGLDWFGCTCYAICIAVLSFTFKSHG